MTHESGWCTAGCDVLAPGGEGVSAPSTDSPASPLTSDEPWTSPDTTPQHPGTPHTLHQTQFHNSQIQHTISIQHHTVYVGIHLTPHSHHPKQLPSTPHTLSGTLLETTQIYPIPFHSIQVILTPDTNGNVRGQCIPTVGCLEKYSTDFLISNDYEFYISYTDPSINNGKFKRRMNKEKKDEYCM